MRGLYVFVLSLALLAATLAITAQDQQNFIDGVKKEINSILDVVDTNRVKLNAQIAQAEAELRQKELLAAKSEFEEIAAKKRLEQQEFVQKQVAFMNSLISDPTTLKTQPTTYGKIPSRAHSGRNCLEILAIKTTSYTTGLHFITRKRKTVPQGPEVTKQLYCGEEGTTLVGAINFDSKRKSGAKLIPTLQEKSKEMNADDLAQTKCASFDECFFFLPKTTKNLNVILTYIKKTLDPVTLHEQSVESSVTFKVKAADIIRIQTIMQKLFSLLSTSNTVLKEKGVKCGFNAGAAVTICGNESDLITSDSVLAATNMRLFV